MASCLKFIKNIVVAVAAADADRFNEDATKFYRGIGGAESDIRRGLIQFNENMPPSQLKAYIQEQATLMRDKISQLQQRWHQGMGDLVPDFPVINSDGQRGLSKIFPEQGQQGGRSSRRKVDR